ncbi:MAG: protease inhibitor I42 family protein [Opitutae bacterium]|nr:protease inhibitor I42 family protein [Opitutae bacterium]
MSRLTFLLAAALLSLGFLSGCQTATEQQLRLTEADHGRTVRIKKGAGLEVVMPSDAAAGYTWQVADLNPSFMRIDGTPTYTPGETAGAPGKATFRLMSVNRGQTTLRLVYLQPAEKDRPPEKSYAVMITIY